VPSFSRAESQWARARLGSFETVSDNGRKSAIQGLSQFEQFRFALGAVMGQPELRLDPPLRILVFRNAQEMAAQGCAGISTGRDRQMACTTSEGQLPPDLVRELTRRLLESNFSSMPAPIERALETFFSTVQSNAVHVMWGAPPPAADRTREWAMLHMLITQPEYSGRAHIYLHNLASGMDSNGAIRSLSEDPVKLNAAVDRYVAAGVYAGVAAPSRPLNPERDFSTTVMTSDEGRLARADLLTAGAEAEYRALLKEGKDTVEAEEGLAILAMRAGDTVKAKNYIKAARRNGTKNAVALTTWGAMEPDSEQAIAILKEALTIDEKYAPAHWALGEKISDPRRRMAEWKQAVALAPRNYQWLEQYAKLCEQQKQYAEAGRAWLGAAQSAPDPAKREQYLASRGKIDELRFEDEERIRLQEAAAKAAELERLKAQARKELADLEARANTRPLSKEETAKVVDWADVNPEPQTLAGNLTRVDCVGRQLTLTVRDSGGKLQKLTIADASKVEMKTAKGEDATLACGIQKTPPAIRISYNPAGSSQKGATGEVISLELH